MGKIREAEAFDAKQYVQDKLDELHKEVVPKTWNYKVLPPNVIRNLMKDRYYYKEEKFPYYRYNKHMEKKK